MSSLSRGWGKQHLRVIELYPLLDITALALAIVLTRLHHAKGMTDDGLRSAGGKGLHRFHSTSNKASVVDEFANIKIEVVCRDRSRAEQIAERVLKECFTDYPGIMYLENVEVMRPEHF